RVYWETSKRAREGTTHGQTITGRQFEFDQFDKKTLARGRVRHLSQELLAARRERRGRRGASLATREVGCFALRERRTDPSRFQVVGDLSLRNSGLLRLFSFIFGAALGFGPTLRLAGRRFGPSR